MRKVLLTAVLLVSLVSSAIAGSSSDFLVRDNSSTLEKNQNIGIDIAPLVSNFKGDIGTGIEFGVGYRGYIINYTKLLLHQ